MFYPAQTQEEQDEDFWADFFVVGQDQDIAFEDGFYYLKLFVNDEVVGDIEVEFLGESRLVNASELGFVTFNTLSDRRCIRPAFLWLDDIPFY